MKKLFLFIAAALVSITMWADITYYTPTTSTEIIYMLNSDGNALVTHAALTNTSKEVQEASKKSGDPTTVYTTPAPTSGNVHTTKIKINNAAKMVQLDIAGCSEIVACHEKHSSRHVKATITPDGEESTTEAGSNNTYFTTFVLDGTKSYRIQLEGDNNDLGLYAVVLKQYVDPGCKTPTVTFSAAKALADLNEEVALTFTSQNTKAVAYAIKKGGAATEDASITDGKFAASVAGTYVITATQDADETNDYCAVEESVTIKVASLLQGWVVFDGAVDEALRTSPITNDAVSMSYEAASTSIVDAGSKKLVGTTRTYSKLIQISKSTGGYLKFTVPSGYTATFTHAFSGTGNRTIILASSKINSTSSEGYIATLCSANSGDIKWGEYTTPLAAGDYYICDCNNGNWQIAELVFDLQSTTFAPSFTSPASEPATVYYEKDQEAAQLSVTATGGPAPSLRWYTNTSKTTVNATETDSTAATFTPSTATAGDFYYYCVATNASGSANSHFFHINVTDAKCPSGLSISGDNEYDEYEDIELTASLLEGNGEISYNWYKGTDLAAAKAAGSIGTGTTYSKASCSTTDAGNYFCVATKDGCSDAESSAYAVEVAEVVPCYTFTPKTVEARDTLNANSEASTSVGGKMVVVEGSTIVYTPDGLAFEKTGNSKVNVTLNNKMKAGTIIKATLWQNDTKTGRILLLNTSTGVNKASWDATPATTDGEEKNFEYVVVAGDGLAGTNVFQLQRSGNVYLHSLKVVNCGEDVPTDVENVANEAKAAKRLVNGQLFIEKNGHVYNVLGGCVK